MKKNFPLKAKVTIGADFLNKEITIDNQKVSLQIWDTAGQEQYQALGKAYYRGSDFCIFVFDVSDRNSFEHLSNWIETYTQYSNLKEAKIENDFPMIVFGNKIDHPSRMVSENEAVK